MREQEERAVTQELIRDIVYILSVFVPYDEKDKKPADRFYRMKYRIYPPYRSCISFMGNDALEQLVEKNSPSPYMLLEQRITQTVDLYYSDKQLSSVVWKTLEQYGARTDIFRNQFQTNLEQSKKNTVKAVLAEFQKGIVWAFDLPRMLEGIDKVIAKRLEAADRFISASYGQLLRYMILWEYQDAGYSKYIFLTQCQAPCEDCRRMNGQSFEISEARIGENFAPLHPNCDCCTGILDENGEVAFIFGSHGLYGKDSLPLPAEPPPGKPWYETLLLDMAVKVASPKTKQLDYAFYFLDWLTMGKLSEYKNRGERMLGDPNWKDITNWLTLGFFKEVEEVAFPEKRFSLQHWLDSLEVAGILHAVWQGVKAVNAGKTIEKGIKLEKKSQSDFDFGSEDKLINHYKKHKSEFKGIYKSVDDYLQGARDVINNGYKVEYLYKNETRTGYIQFLGSDSKGKAKFAFVGTNLDGNITTFHTESGKTFWKMLNGENIQIINPK